MSYHHLNTLTVLPERLRHNLDVLAWLAPGIQPVPVVKSNAYGHGIKIVAPLLAKYDVPFVCVDSLYEAYELLKHGYKRDVLIMGYVNPRDIPRRKQFIYAVSEIEYGLALVRQYSRVRLHLFFDTGMHREGITLKPLPLPLSEGEGNGKESYSLPFGEGWGGVCIEWVMSHLSTPDNMEVTNTQLASFQASLDELSAQGISPRYIHIFASGGIINVKNYTNPFHIPLSTSQSQIARTWLAFYGYGHPDLLPALRLTTTLIQTKNIQAGEKVGYDGTFTAEKDMKIGVLPIGYNDGLDRRLSNIGMVSIRGTLCPIIGRVSMNLTTIDISHLEAQVGDEVLIIDEDPASPISLLAQSTSANMIPYDMLVHWNREMYRVIS